MFKKLLLISVMFAANAMLPAHAVSLSFSPSAQSVAAGDQAIVDIVVSGLEAGGLNQIVAGYDLSFTYDSSILSFVSGNFTDLEPTGFLTVDTATSGLISWNSTAITLTELDLQGIQGASVTLASIVFNTLSAGTSALNFSFPVNFPRPDLTGLGGNPLEAFFDSGRITVTANGSVPEPATMLLMGLGALGMVGTKRRKA